MLISKGSDYEAPLMYGYAFEGADLVYETEGLRRFEEATGKTLRGGEDGCYAVVRQNDRHLEVETDFFGSRKIFYYWTPEFWVVSDSWARLVDHLREIGQRVRPRYSVLAAMRPSAAMHALTTHHTAAEGVEMLPLQTKLCIGDHGVQLTQGSVKSNFGLTPPSESHYAHHLKEYLELWVARFRTLMTTPALDINLDLTGGADSRCNFALVLAAARGVEEQYIVSPPQFRCGGTETSKDLPIAKQVAEAFGYRINHPPRADRSTLGPKARYYLWRNVNLGVYNSIYMPNGGYHPHEISFGGGGAENYRPFYSRPDRTGSGRDVGAVDKFVHGTQRRLLHEHLKGDYSRDLREFFDGLPTSMSETQQLIAHYRNFRSRIHVGRTPNYKVKFIPFSSPELDRACAHLDDDKIRAGQVNYDIMNSLEPRLLEIDFDSETKRITPWIKDRLTTVEVDATKMDGAIWGETHTGNFKPDGHLEDGADNNSAYDYLTADYELAKSDSFVTSFWPNSVLQDADNALAYRAEHGKFSHATQGAPLSWILVTKAVSPRNL